MKWIVIAVALLVVLSVVGTLYVRLAGHDPAKWHVDPVTVTEVDTFNQHLGDVLVSQSTQAVAAAISDIIGGELLSGSFESGFATVVVRTPLVGYPDYISVRIAEEDTASRVTIFSRSRFGKSDLGANKKRIERIFDDLEAALDASS